MQNKNEYNIFDRSEVYASGLMYNSLKMADGYTELPKTIAIWLLGFNMFDDGPYHEILKLKRNSNGKDVPSKREIHFIQLPKFLEQVTE